MYVCSTYIFSIDYVVIYVYMYHIHTSLQRDSLWYISHRNLVAFLPMVHLKCTMAGHGTFQMYHRQECHKSALNSIHKSQS